MRKIYIGAAIAVCAIGAATYGLFASINQRATDEVDRMLASLRAAGATATRGPIEFDLWSRTLVVRDIAVKQPAAGANSDSTLAVTKVTAAGIDPWSSAFAASKLELTGLTLAGAFRMDAANTMRFAQAIPTLVLTHFKSAGQIPDVAAATDTMTKGASMFATLKASSISVPTLDMKLSLPRPRTPGQPPPPPGSMYDLGYTYSNALIKDLDDGRIGKATVERVEIIGGPGSPVVSGAMAGFAVTDIDLLPMFGVGLDRRKADNGYYKIQGATSVDGYTFKMLDGGEMQLGAISGDNVGIDPTKVTYAKLMEMIQLASTIQPGAAPAQSAAFGEAIGGLYEGLRWGRLEMRGMRLRTPAAPDEVKFARMSMTGLDKGKLGDFRIEGVEGMMPSAPGRTAPFKLGVFALKGMDFSGMMRSIARFSQPGAAASFDPIQMLAFLEGFEIADTAAPDPTTGQMVRIDKVQVDWGRFVANVPTQARMVLKVSGPINPADPNMAMLASKGVRTIDVSADIAANLDPGARTLTLKPLSLGLGRLGEVSAELSVGNVAPAAISFVPGQSAALAQRFELLGLDLKVSDTGMLALFGPPPASAAEMQTSLGQAHRDPANPSANLDAVLAAASRFLVQPGQTLSLKVRAKTPMSWAQLFAPGGPMTSRYPLSALLDQYAVEASVR